MVKREKSGFITDIGIQHINRRLFECFFDSDHFLTTLGCQKWSKGKKSGLISPMSAYNMSIDVFSNAYLIPTIFDQFEWSGVVKREKKWSEVLKKQKNGLASILMPV